MAIRVGTWRMSRSLNFREELLGAERSTESLVAMIWMVLYQRGGCASRRALIKTIGFEIWDEEDRGCQ